MNRTQAKAHAAELGISKDTARQFGSLSKTQTWLDAIAAKACEQVVADDAKSQAPAPEGFELETEKIDSAPDLLAPITEANELKPSSTVAEASCGVSDDPWTEASAELDVTQIEKQPLQQVIAPASAPLIYPVFFLSIAVWSVCQMLLGLALALITGFRFLHKLISRPQTQSTVNNPVAMSPVFKTSLET